jgi:hypothetical protein
LKYASNSSARADIDHTMPDVATMPVVWPSDSANRSLPYARGGKMGWHNLSVLLLVCRAVSHCRNCVAVDTAKVLGSRYRQSEVLTPA